MLCRRWAYECYALLFRRQQPHFRAFDVLEIDRNDLRGLPLVERKRKLRAIMPRSASRRRYVDGIRAKGVELYRRSCELDLEGVVAKWANGQYQDRPGTSCLKIKNPAYSQMERRHGVFESRRSTHEGRRAHVPVTLNLC